MKMGAGGGGGWEGVGKGIDMTQVDSAVPEEEQVVGARVCMVL